MIVIYAIETEELTKTYKNGTQALAGITFSLQKGKVLTVAGPNGAGKTTLLRILATSLLPTSGKVNILGFDAIRNPKDVRSRIAIVPQEGQPERYLTCWQCVFCYLLARGFSWREAKMQAKEKLIAVGLWDRRNMLSSELSGGQRQRVRMAMALSTGAELLFLDEPTSGMDPEARREVITMLGALHDKVTIVVTTHLLDEAEYLSDQVMFVANGQIKALDTPDALKQLVPSQEKLILTKHEGFNNYRDYGTTKEIGDKIILYPYSSATAKLAIETIIDNHQTVSLQPITLEDVYFSLLGKKLKEELTCQ